MLAGCGLGTAGGYVPGGTLAGPLADVGPLDGATISIGSKNFSENILLGKMALILLKADGATVVDLTNIPGSASARQAHLEGQIDAMWEYTGTGWITYLGHDKPIPDEQSSTRRSATRMPRRTASTWLPPAPMNNTYGFAITEQSAKKYGITKLSEIEGPGQGAHVLRGVGVRQPPRRSQRHAQDVRRAEGQAHGVPGDNIGLYQTGAIYDATAKGNCTFGEVFTTDGRILSLNLTVLEDDRKYFPNYNVSLVVRDPVLEDHPEIEELIAPVAEKLTNEVLLEAERRDRRQGTRAGGGRRAVVDRGGVPRVLSA